MKIFIEGGAMLGKRTGIGHYATRLIDAAATSDPKNNYTIFGFRFYASRRPRVAPITPSGNLSYHLIRWIPAVIYIQLFKRLFTLPIDLVMGRRADIFFFPNFVSWPVLSRKAKVIPVIHDLSFIHFGQYSSPQNREYMRKFVPKTIRSADHIVTISENSKKEIAEYYSVDPSNISVVTPAIDHDIYHPQTGEEIAEVKTKYSLPDAYFLFTSTLEPRKNVQGLLDAYALLPKQTQDKYALVLVGMKGWVDEEIQSRLDKYSHLNIMRTGYVEDEDLPAIYSGATLFVFPTFYEGFGMPPLEAMACGTPVISSNNSSVPEVVGDAGILLDSVDPPAISKAIEELVHDDKLRTELHKKGIQRAALFSWDKSSRKLRKVFEETVKKRRSR